MNCKHYNRFVELICKQCISDKKQKKVNWACRFCHNEKCLHELNRHDIDQMKCLFCKCVQPKINGCINPDCYNKKHDYYCSKCSLWINSKKDYYHCDKCNICREGTKDTLKHCDKCNLCWHISSFDNHTCKFDQLSNNCPICMESIWDYKDSVRILDCGHSFHSNCINQYLTTNYNCPICKKSIVNMDNQWDIFDQIVENTPVPDEYKNWMVEVLCNDCLNKTNLPFNMVNLYKCGQCGSYNTQQNSLKKN